MKLKICLMGLLCFFLKVSAQNKNQPFPLKPGDIIPDSVLGNVLNFKENKLRLSDFHNKLLILDFWSTSCASCIEMFPREVELQQKFRDSLQFLLVDSRNTRDKPERIVKFFSVFHPSYRSLPTLTDDSVLSGFFPHSTVGYYVWVYNNRVLTMADEQDLSEVNIRAFLHGSGKAFSKTIDIPYDPNRPIFLAGNGGDAPDYLFRSVITPYKPGLHTSVNTMMEKGRLCRGFSFINCRRFDIYVAAHPELQNIDYNRMLFRVADATQFSNDSISESWRKQNLFTYEVSFPPVPVQKALQYMRSDLEKVFFLRVDSVMRDTDCYVLEGVSGEQAAGSGLEKPGDWQHENFIRDYPVSVFVSLLNAKSTIPYIDESGFSGTVRTLNNLEGLSTDELTEKLAASGLRIVSARRKIRFYIISQIDSDQPSIITP